MNILTLLINWKLLLVWFNESDWILTYGIFYSKKYEIL